MARLTILLIWTTRNFISSVSHSFIQGEVVKEEASSEVIYLFFFFSFFCKRGYMSLLSRLLPPFTETIVFEFTQTKA